MEEEIQSSNINELWLKNIFEQLKATQEMERLAMEGCGELMEYIEMPMENKNVIISEAQYKNMRFFAMELDLMLNNLAPVLKDEIKKLRLMLDPILENLDNKKLFIKYKMNQGQIVQAESLPFLNLTTRLLSKIRAEIIKDISPLLYIPDKDPTKKLW